MATIQQDVEGVLREILRMRRVEQQTEPDIRDEIASTREFLEDSIGATVRPAVAARLLGISQPSLHRWLRKGDITTVLTREGRREIPLSELLGLLEDVEARINDGFERPLGRVLAERRQAAAEVDVDQLIPRSRRRTHRVADMHALAYHRLIAERLDPAIVERARRRLERWEAQGRINPLWAAKWRRILSRSLPDIAKAISADTPNARDLRQTSPFAGVLNEHERRQLHEAVEQRFG